MPGEVSDFSLCPSLTDKMVRWDFSVLRAAAEALLQDPLTNTKAGLEVKSTRDLTDFT